MDKEDLVRVLPLAAPSRLRARSGTTAGNIVPNNSSKTVYIYDGAARRTKGEEYDSHGHLSARTVSTYDEAGHNARDEKYDSRGQLSFITVYTYDQAGHNTKKEDYGPDGKTLTGWSTFKFDSKGLRIEEDVFGAKGECEYLTKTTYTFYP